MDINAETHILDRIEELLWLLEDEDNDQIIELQAELDQLEEELRDRRIIQ